MEPDRRPEPAGSPEPADLAGPGPVARRNADNGFSGNPRSEKSAAEQILLLGRDIRTGRRAEAGKEFQEARRLRNATVILVVLVILTAPLVFYVIREAARDPVLVELDALELPNWAAGDPRDESMGSRWCIEECRFTQRTWRSQRGPEETSKVYEKALTAAGWRPWRAPGCPPEDVDGVETCWQRDEYVLDLWVHQPECQVEERSPAPDGSGAGTAPEVEAVCPPTVVMVKVVNRVAYRTPAGAAPG